MLKVEKKLYMDKAPKKNLNVSSIDTESVPEKAKAIVQDISIEVLKIQMASCLRMIQAVDHNAIMKEFNAKATLSMPEFLTFARYKNFQIPNVYNDPYAFIETHYRQLNIANQLLNDEIDYLDVFELFVEYEKTISSYKHNLTKKGKYNSDIFKYDEFMNNMLSITSHPLILNMANMHSVLRDDYTPFFYFLLFIYDFDRFLRVSINLTKVSQEYGGIVFALIMLGLYLNRHNDKYKLLIRLFKITPDTFN